MINSSAQNVFEALEFIARTDTPPTLAMIARQQHIPISTAFRIVSTLQNTGFIRPNGQGGGFVLGNAAPQIAQALFNRFKIRRVAHPFLQQLALMTGETCCLTIPIGWYGVRIFAVRGTNEVVLSPLLGEAVPLGDNLPSKAILAFFPEHRISGYANWHARTFSRRFARNEMADLADSRKRGFVLEPHHDRSGKSAIAFPIVLKGTSIASISIEGPVFDRTAARTMLARWTDVRTQIEALVDRQPELFRNPFAHIDPDGIRLPAAQDDA